MAQLPFSFHGSSKGQNTPKAQEKSEEETGPLQRTQEPREKQRVYSVSEIHTGLKRAFEAHFGLIFVQGEMLGFSVHPNSGHAYFTLQDQRAQMKCVMWGDYVRRLRFEPKDGVVYILRGKLSTYERSGTLQLNAVWMEPKGLGALQAALLERARVFRDRGWFAPELKKPIPRFPQTIGVVSSLNGAAVHDVLRTLRRRNRAVTIILVNAHVQGQTAPKEISHAIKSLDGRVELILLVRGGGSPEDLAALSEERVVESIFQAQTPIITGIGHETDTSLADAAADLALSTPTAAAEAACEPLNSLEQEWRSLHRRLNTAHRARIQYFLAQLLRIEKRLISPKDRIQTVLQRLDELDLRLAQTLELRFKNAQKHLFYLNTRLDPARVTLRLHQRNNSRAKSFSSIFQKLHDRMRLHLIKKESRFEKLNELLKSLSPLKILARGYAVVQSELGDTIFSTIENVKPNDEVSVRLYDGRFKARVLLTEAIDTPEKKKDGGDLS